MITTQKEHFEGLEMAAGGSHGNAGLLRSRENDTRESGLVAAQIGIFFGMILFWHSNPYSLNWLVRWRVWPLWSVAPKQTYQRGRYEDVCSARIQSQWEDTIAGHGSTPCAGYDEQLKQSFLMASLTVAPRSPRVVSAWSGAAVSKCKGERRRCAKRTKNWQHPQCQDLQCGLITCWCRLGSWWVWWAFQGVKSFSKFCWTHKADSFSGYGPWRRWSALEVWGTKFTKIVVFRSDSWLLGCLISECPSKLQTVVTLF